MQIPLHDKVKDSVREAYILQLVNHPNVIGIKEGIVKEGKLVLILEHACYGDLGAFCLETKALRPELLGQRMAMHVLYQMALALEYLHSNCIAHRDIKPANIVLGSGGIFKVRNGCEPRRWLYVMGSAACI